MKVFRQEGKKNVVYVQLKDLLFIANQKNLMVTRNIHEIVNKSLNVSDEEKEGFIKFTEKVDIYFLKQQTYIINYADYKNKSSEEISKEAHSVILKAKDVATKYNSRSEHSSTLKHQHDQLVYQYHAMLEFKQALEENKIYLPV